MSAKRGIVVLATCVLGFSFGASSARAFGGFRYQVPNGFTQGCITCHNNPNGGTACANATATPARVALAWSALTPAGSCAGCASADVGEAPCLNAFGRQYYETVILTGVPAAMRWGAMYNLDADGDGWTNGMELGDSTGSWVATCSPSPCSSATNTPVTNEPTYYGHPGDTGAGYPEETDLCCVPAPNEDIDECSAGYDTCADPGSERCDNLVARPGLSFTCVCGEEYGGASCDECATGYGDPGDGTCVDVDECLDMPCDVNAACVNAVGTFDCLCAEHWTGDGFTCADLDECTEGTAVCPANEHCVNELGAVYSCACDTGFTREDEVCTEVCGDGARGPSEGCDDGDNDDDDGCDGDCSVEDGYECAAEVGEASVCALLPVPDAGVDAGSDAGSEADGGGIPTPRDAGADGGSTLEGGSCACGAGAPRPSGLAWMFAALAVYFVRRRMGS